MYRSRARRAVAHAMIALWLSGPVAAVVLAFVLPALIFGSATLDSEVAGAIAKSVAGAGIWTAYLAMSKRVKARYGNGPSIPVATAPAQV